MTAEVLLTASREGVARATRDRDGSWHVTRPYAEDRVHCLTGDPASPDVAYAGTESSGVLRSVDRGMTWSPVGAIGRPVRALAVSPHDARLLFAGVRPAALWRSLDGGASWSELEGFRRIRGRRLWFSPVKPYSAYVHGIALSPTDADVVIVGIEFGAVVRSADGGRTWSRHRRGAMRDCHSLCFHATDGSRAYEGGFGGAALSTDGGVTWARPRDGLDRRYGWAVAADPARPDVVYVSIAPGPQKAHGEQPAEAFVFRRIGEAPWEKLGGGLPGPLDSMPYALLTNPARPGQLTAGIANGEVWRTTDLGETWSRLPLHLPPFDQLLALA